jgi:hypothetical protein
MYHFEKLSSYGASALHGSAIAYCALCTSTTMRIAMPRRPSMYGK